MVNPDASLHCNVTSNAPAVVVQTGEVLSTFLIVAGDSEHPGMELAVPARVDPQSALSTYLTLIL